ELEFTTLLKDLAPAEETRTAEYIAEPSADDLAEFLREAQVKGFALAVPLSALETATEQVSEQETESLEEREPELKTMSLLDLVDEAEKTAGPEQATVVYKVAIASNPEKILLVPLDEVRSLLEDEAV